MNHQRTSGIFAAIVGMALVTHATAAITWVPAELAGTPGAKYHLAFITEDIHDMVSSDIATYNSFVDGLGDAIPGKPAGLPADIRWRCIASTTATSAAVNISTWGDPLDTGQYPVYLIGGSGSKVKATRAGLWTSSLLYPINAADTGGVHEWVAITGTSPSGSQSLPLGTGADVGIGQPNMTSSQWVTGGIVSSPFSGHFYAISEPLTVPTPTTAPAITYADTGDGTERPVSIQGITVTGILYDATIVYNRLAQTDPYRVGDLPDEHILRAAIDVAAALNARTDDDAYYTAIFFQPHLPLSKPGYPTHFRADAIVKDDLGSNDGDWHGSASGQWRPESSNPASGYIQFTTIQGAPALSTCGVFVLVLSLAGVACWRAKRLTPERKAA